MYMLAINHDVQDYGTWKAAFDDFPPSKGGALFHRVNRSVDSDKNITVVAGFETVAAAREFIGNPDLKARMSEAGVLGAPRFELFEELEAVQY
jgi:hypothetical protein